MTKPCTSTTGPNFPSDNNDSEKSACTTTPPFRSSCPTRSHDLSCKEFQLDKNRDSCFIDNVVNESLNIGGATFNVYKLLGVHEQGRLVDVAKRGNAISNGDLPGFPASNAFDAYITEWRSIQKGDGVPASAYIGYDFGEIKLPDSDRRKYGIETSVRKHITAFAIKQSPNSNNRVTRARLERSEDGKKWYGVSIVELPDDDCLNTILTKSSVPSRYWRLRALEFNGSSTDYWGVQAIQLFDNYLATNIDNIQDKVFFENRDRDYSSEPLAIKGSYDLVDVTTELSKFGIELPSQTIYAQVSFSACVAILGRPLVIGDIIEIPSEAQYSPTLEKIEKWMEVTDVAWSTEGYTPGWQPTLLRVILQPALATQETQDIFGDLAEQDADDLGLVTGNDGNNPIFQDYADISQTIEAEAKDDVPERGAEGSSTIRYWTEEELKAAYEQGLFNLKNTGLNPTQLYVEDAMPPNNAPFTEGDSFPENPKDGDYHRLTYSGLAQDVPARLYRYSETKGRWIYLETDRRAQYNDAKPTLQEFLTSPTAVPHNKITSSDGDQ